MQKRNSIRDVLIIGKTWLLLFWVGHYFLSLKEERCRSSGTEGSHGVRQVEEFSHVQSLQRLAVKCRQFYKLCGISFNILVIVHNGFLSSLFFFFSSHLNSV